MHEAGVRDGSGFRRPVPGAGAVVHRAERAVDDGGAAAFDSDVRVEFVNGR